MPKLKTYLRRHKKDTNNRTKFTCVRVNLILSPSLASGKQINKQSKNLVCIVTIFSSRKITSQRKTGQTKDHILYITI